MLVVKNVSKVYANNKKAVDNLDLEIQKGEIIGFIGPNGAGKTTTIRMITGIIAPTEGTIEINGKDIARESVEAKKNFTFVPDHPTIFDAIKGIDYLNFITDMYEVDLKQRKEQIEKYTRAFHIYDALGQTINSYSHGMK